jgi:outer membrane protein OmpA-like peptidoglycan-associated protein
MKATDLAMMPAPAAVAATEKPKPTTIAAVIPAQNYFVFFDWDSTALSEGAQSVLAAAVQRTRETGQSVSLVGHADASGTTAYNSGLSQRRAEMVKQTLVSSGVPANSIASRWVGEGDPLVVTGDGVREPQNRRVEIIVEKMMPTS